MLTTAEGVCGYIPGSEEVRNLRLIYRWNLFRILVSGNRGWF